ncbi:MAG: hypothetical protein ACRER8_12090 [Pseudomonas sp.]|uniref:hypothetical protein n=1 Tax=Pseudomonas sp. TaxID=306 RepID=UPI003D6DCB2C
MAVRDQEKKRARLKLGRLSNADAPLKNDEGHKEALLEALKQARDLREALAATRRAETWVPEEAPLSVEESKRRLEEEIAKARERQVAWIEALGPPQGWVKLDDLAELGWVKSGDIGMDSPSDRDNTEEMTEITDYRKELELRDELLRKELHIRHEAFQRELDTRDKVHAERSAAVLLRIDDRDKVIDSKLDGISTKISGIVTKVDGFDTKINDSVRLVRNSNWATLGGMLTIGIAIVLGVWGVNSTIISSASGIFASGQEAQKTQTANEQVLKDTQELLRQLKSNPPPAPPPSPVKGG